MQQLLRPRATPFALVLAVPLAFACAPDRTDTEAEPAGTPAPAAEADAPAELQRASDGYIAAWNGTDVDAVAMYFTENAMATVDGEMYHGRAEIRTGWIEQAIGAVSNLRITEETLRREGDGYVSEGRYTLTWDPPDDDAMDASGRYTATWTQDADGEWRLSNTTIVNDEPAQG